MRKFILAIDQGTTSTRAIIVDSKASVIAISQKETNQSFPKQGWVEQDAEEILNNVLETLSLVVQKANISPHQESKASSRKLHLSLWAKFQSTALVVVAVKPHC